VTDDTVGRIVSARVASPKAIAEAAAARARRPELTGASGRLFIITADHPARGSLGAGADPMAMADRAELLRQAHGRVRSDLSADAMVRSAAVAAAPGTTSAYTWLKLPVVEDMARVDAATSLPVLLPGGEATADDGAVADRWRVALKLPTVHGMVIGRTLLYSPGGDVASVVDRTVGLP